jgi:hypothetical protein
LFFSWITFDSNETTLTISDKVIGFFILSLVISLCQRYALRIILANADWWTIATIGGTLVGVISALFLRDSFWKIIDKRLDWGILADDTFILEMFIHLIFILVPVSFCQWVVLLRSVRHAWLWLPVNMASLMVSLLVGITTLCFFPFVVGLGHGVSTGVLIYWLYQKHPQPYFKYS